MPRKMRLFPSARERRRRRVEFGIRLRKAWSVAVGDCLWRQLIPSYLSNEIFETTLG